MRFWERACRRSGFELLYSEGFTPHARISLAAPLPVGIISQVELMDIWLSRWESPDLFLKGLSKQLPIGIGLNDVKIISLDEPSMQSTLRFAEYIVELESEKTAIEIESSIRSLLSSENLPWKHMRDKGEKRYDLRTLVDDVWLISNDNTLCKLGMRLRCDTLGSGRPEQVTIALGFQKRPISIQRTALIF